MNNNDQWKYVLLNPLSGNVNFLNKEFYHYIQGRGTKKADPTKDDRLRGRGYLYQDKREEEIKKKQVFDDLYKSIEKNKRNNYVIVPQNTCSMGCSYCQYQNKLDGRILSETDLGKIIDFIVNFDKKNHIEQKPILKFYGNEALPNNDEGFNLIKKVLEDYTDHFIHISFNTFSFNLERYKELIQNSDMKKLSFMFRLQENEDTRKGKMEGKEILSGANETSLDWLRLHGIHTVLRIKITQENLEKIPGYVNYLIGKGIVYSSNCLFQFNPTFKKKCTLFNTCSVNYELYKKIFEIYKEHPQLESADFSGHGALEILIYLLKSRGRFAPKIYFCNANWNLLIFTPEGNIFPCYHTIQNPNLALGNINDAKGIDMTKLNQWRRKSVEALEECVKCPAKYLCGGGCSFEALTKKGSILKSNCQPYKDLIKWTFESLHEDFLESERYKQIHEEYVAADR